MAKSIQIFGERDEIFNDIDLLVLIALVHERVNEVPASAELVDLIFRWWQGIKKYGPGTIDLELERLPFSSDVHRELVTILETMSERFDRFDAFVPAGYLNSLSIASGVYFVDFPTTHLRRVTDQLRRLLEPCAPK